jgi:hypothetical protein
MSNNTLCWLMLSTGLSSCRENSSASEQPLRPSWLNYIAARPHLRQSRLQWPTTSGGGGSTTFFWASQNMTAAAALLDTLPTPSTDGVDKVYQQLKNIFIIAIAQLADNSL